MKVIAVDNYARETVSDILICENVNEYFGEKIVNFLNEGSTDWYFMLVSDDYELYNTSLLY